jgi:hypothetical protein
VVFVLFLFWEIDIMAVPNESRKPIVVSDENKDAMTETQLIVYKELAAKLQAARFEALEEQRMQEKSNQANKENAEYNDAANQWKKETSKDASMTAQTLPATLIYEMVMLSNLWGVILKHALDKELEIPAQYINALLSKPLRELAFKTKNGITRLFSGDGQLALPELSHYVGLGKDGMLKIDPVYHRPSQKELDAGKKDLDDGQKHLNDLYNIHCMDWLDKKGYDIDAGYVYKKGCPVPHLPADRLLPEQFSKLATDPNDGIDAYLLQQCRVHFIMKEKPDEEPVPPTPGL